MQHPYSNFELIEKQSQLDHFYAVNRQCEWMGLDTEFVGEKRFVTLLCLIQVSTPNGNYIIDPLQLNDLGPFLQLIQDPAILKITHAGENEYRIFYQQYDVVPANVFDTQLAAAFLGYKHPVSFRRLAENELGLKVDKTLTTADWEARPLNKSYLRYALDDVAPLHALMQQMETKLRKHGRLEWAREEFALLENADYYAKDPNDEALNNSMMKSLNFKEKIFMLRLYQWRREQAEAKNYSKEMILPAKYIAPIVKGISAGLDALRHNRRLPERTIQQFGRLFVQFYQQPATAEEKNILTRLDLSEEDNDDPMEEIMQEMLYLLVRYKCLESGITPAFVMPKGVLRKLKSNPEDMPENLETGWRRQMLGEDIFLWMKHYERLEMSVASGRIELRVRP
ncbi:MAG: ribonuclease D [Saprospiraceae bacterium]|nr:ribonuclease D [Saprospiraceae bacterium]HRD80215.1 ribonuclease D [Saprospiraceae bacterium]HRK83411.1 ribonuclease D [Saprospiraceae bacterium]